MNPTVTILIADKNRHIREFLHRELEVEGYKTRMTNDGREVLKAIKNEPPDLIVVDPEIPYVDGATILEFLQKNKFHIPVIVHAVSLDDMNTSAIRYPVVFVEKGGNTIDGLKADVASLLAQSRPRRSPSPLNQSKLW